MITVETNIKDFNRAMQAYYAASKYEWPDILNRKGLQLAFEALNETPKAEREAIRNLEKLDWWPKYVANRIKAGFTFSKRAKGVQSKVTIKGRFTKEMAREVSKKIIAGRLRSVAFLKAGWLPAIRTLFPRVRNKPFVRMTAGGAKQYGRDKGSAVAARPTANPFAEIVNSAEGIEKIGRPALARAMAKVTADMLSYIAQRNVAVWSRFFRV